MPSEKTVTKCSEARRSTKPIMEKRRRARINNSLSELKNLILDALKKDNARHSKLEKADILEMTVKHLQNLQTQQPVAEPSSMAKYRSGFAECANEVSRFFSRVEGVDPVVRQRLLSHLANCMSSMNNPLPSQQTTLPPVHVQVDNVDNTRLLSGVQLVPTRLSNGDIAFLLPAQLSVYTPSTVPISPAPSASSPSPALPSSPSPVNVLGSSGILSPAASDRCTPSPVSYSKYSPQMSSYPSDNSYHHYSHMPQVIKPEPESVWRPW